MKKILSIFSILFAFAALNANAEEKLYLNDTNLQVGTDGVIELCIEAENAIGTVNAVFELPEGVTVTEVESEGAAVTFNENENNLLLGKGKPYFSTGVVAKIHVKVASDVKLGDYPMTVTFGKIVEPSLKTYDFANVESTLTIQKTAVIEDQDPNYLLEVIPFAVAKDATSATASVNLTNKDEVAFISFDVTFPAGITPSKTGRTYDKPIVNSARLTNGGAITPLSAKTAKNENGTFHYEIVNDEVDTYAKNGSGLAMTIPLALSGVAEGVYTVMVNNISVKSTTDYESFTNHTGEYYFSVFVGEPITDAILYGHYTTEGQKAAAAMKGGSADITAATIDGELALNDVLVLAKDKTTYNRAVGSSNYATICVPFALKGSYYTVSEKTETSITLKEATEVPANTPAITKGDIAVSAEGYVPAEAPVAGANGLTGTYTYIKEATGYYLSGNKFYNDWAAVKPFRAYIPAAGGAKSLSIYLETANGIIDITDQLSNEDIYSLQGIKLNKTQKGINIVGGKKIYNK